jgi:hypothetical protein
LAESVLTRRICFSGLRAFEALGLAPSRRSITDLGSRSTAYEPQSNHVRLALGGLIVSAICIDLALALPVRGPHIFGDELVYWDLSRTFASTGHLTARGGAHLGYGPGYPALIAVAHVLGGSERSAYLLARALNTLFFSLAAVPAHAIARRVLSWRLALGAAALAALVPSAVYTSAIMTESAFYPMFLTCVWLMLRALERPAPARQIALLGMIGVAFSVRAQAVVLVPAYVAAVVALHLLERGEARRSHGRSLFREQMATIVVLAGGTVTWLLLSFARGYAPLAVLGPYRVLFSGHASLDTLRWALANVADLELYVGVVPFAAFVLLIVSACTSTTLGTSVRRVVVVSASVSLAMLSSATALSASRYGLGRVHERNLFYVAPLFLIVFLAWIDRGMHRPRRATIAIAPLVALLPLAIPGQAVHRSGLDAIALFWWQLVPRDAVVPAMTVFSTVGLVLFLVVRTPSLLVRVCLGAMLITLLAGDLMSIDEAYRFQRAKTDFGWIDRAVGSESAVFAIWPSSVRPAISQATSHLWLAEFYNRSVRDVASAGGPLPDGLPAERLFRRVNGCLSGMPRRGGGYAIADDTFRIAAPVVVRDDAAHLTLYRLADRTPGQCSLRVLTG